MESETLFTVRYAETDRMGIVHHSNYAIWFEAGRTDFIKKTGISYSSLEEKGILLPLYEMSCKFIYPAKYEDEIAVITELKYLSRVRMLFSYRVINKKDSRLLATGETAHAWTDRNLKPQDAQKAIPEIYAVFCELVKKNS
jgi:acyl-CoA thioester hydrolase